MTLAALALASAALAVLAPAAAFGDSPGIAEMVDGLERSQLGIAQGDRAAYAAELGQLKAIGAAIAATRPETWKDRREADSLVIYILSGGSLGAVAPLLSGDAILESERGLARGALAYVTNHEADALALLGKEDLGALDRRLAGEVAFARSVLETRRNAKAAVELLDWARLLQPGGLVEEAALRREIGLLAEGRDVDRAAMLIRQYSTRFGASLYAADFYRDLAGAVARLGLADDPENFRRLSAAIGSMPPDTRRDFLLNLARSALVGARLSAAAAAAAEALDGANPDSPEAMRARLYLAGSRIFSDAYDSAISDLRAIAVSKLSQADAELLAAVKRLASELRIAPDAGPLSSTDPPIAGHDGEKDKASGAALTIERARQALERTAELAHDQDGPPQ